MKTVGQIKTVSLDPDSRDTRSSIVGSDLSLSFLSKGTILWPKASSTGDRVGIRNREGTVYLLLLLLSLLLLLLLLCPRDCRDTVESIGRNSKSGVLVAFRTLYGVFCDTP
jgi:hypothetical protein